MGSSSFSFYVDNLDSKKEDHLSGGKNFCTNEGIPFLVNSFDKLVLVNSWCTHEVPLNIK